MLMICNRLQQVQPLNIIHNTVIKREFQMGLRIHIQFYIFSGSGSQDGMLCVWDLTTGACIYSIQAHDGAVVSLAHSPIYVVSMGSDEKLCVWERFQGHLINTINLVNI